MKDNDELHTLIENEKYLYDLCKEIYEKLKDVVDGVGMFKEIVGTKLFEKLEDAVAEGDDPRNPA